MPKSKIPCTFNDGACPHAEYFAPQIQSGKIVMVEICRNHLAGWFDGAPLSLREVKVRRIDNGEVIPFEDWMA